ncbi:MAG: SDR family oxidoreductase [Tannerellaceae bacterium]|jgi:NAD(P)-dependent dehydrogenase (short-subunit alcohol dehydrogenase family)|nr:SDR family oxidoreductase [Tannerellaceae bacterium]
MLSSLKQRKLASQFCYICHKPTESGRLCPKCESINSRKREELSPDVRNRIAVVTGGRIKIGYETCLKLLRSGAYVILTTRFPVDAAYRYINEHDFEQWRSRLKIYKIDFRNILQVEEFAAFLNHNISHVDILINNAAQTVRRPKGYYEHLRELESKEMEELPAHVKELIYDKNLSSDFFKFQNDIDRLQMGNIFIEKQLPADNASAQFPIGKTDTNGDPIDLRLYNSWVSKAEDIDTIELLEVQLVNVTTPYILCTRLKQTMKRSPNPQRFIVNVSAMEGKFNRKNKNCYHPHTNMAKAALNMLTRTSAQDYKKDGIYMNSVDTGWITDENPYHIQKRNRRLGITPPLNSKDGAARVLDLIFHSLQTQRFSYGRFFKDYKTTSW